MHAKRKSLALLTAALATLLLEMFPLVRPAHAIIGMPLTPFSYAGVARRTTRRAVYAGAAYGGAYGGAPYGAAAPMYW